MSKLESILGRLQRVKASGQDRFTACCPAHDDKSPSLMVSERNGKIGIHCFGGCGAVDVLAAIGMEMTDLYPDEDRADGLRPWQIKDMEDQVRHARLIIKFYESDKKRGVHIDDHNKKLALDAYKRVKMLTARLAKA